MGKIIVVSLLGVFTSFSWAADVCESQLTREVFQSERTTVFYLDIYQGALLCNLSSDSKAGLEAYGFLIKKFSPVISKNQNILEEYFLDRGLKSDPLNRYMTRLANNFGLIENRGCQRLITLKSEFLETELSDLVKKYEDYYQANLESNPKLARACTFE